MGNELVVFLQSPGWSARHLAVGLALSASALGEAVELALSGEPLRLFLTGRFAEGAPAAAAAAGVLPLDAALEEARRGLGLRIVACPVMVRVEGLDPETVVPPLDALESLPALWRRARAGRSLAV